MLRNILDFLAPMRAAATSSVICEPLERRRLLTQAFYNGSNGGDDILIRTESAGPGIFTVVVDRGTGSTLFQTPASNSLIIDLMGGNDKVDFSGYTPSGSGSVGVSLGDGNDVAQSIKSNNLVNGGNGNDTFIMNTIGTRATLAGGSGNDTVDFSSRSSGVVVDLKQRFAMGSSNEFDQLDEMEVVIGGGASDTLTGSDRADSLIGGGGNDSLFGGGGNDYLGGSAGNDIMDGGLGADTMAGGTGVDTVVYQGRTEDLSITLDELPNDGAPGEGDLVGSTVRGIITGDGRDTIDARNVSASVTIYGGNGNDVILGSRYNDFLRGDADKDYIAGYDGDDIIDGGRGYDSMLGGNGNDTIYARDGLVETVSGGPGFDSAQLDSKDDKQSIENLLA